LCGERGDSEGEDSGEKKAQGEHGEIVYQRWGELGLSFFAWACACYRFAFPRRLKPG
jgi:hypothetical protein